MSRHGPGYYGFRHYVVRRAMRASRQRKIQREKERLRDRRQNGMHLTNMTAPEMIAVAIITMFFFVFRHNEYKNAPPSVKALGWVCVMVFFICLGIVIGFAVWASHSGGSSSAPSYSYDSSISGGAVWDDNP
ncbi:hypothetical protein [Alicyclobacillus shizuokensis]|uniref:hypothetical protein n=1 Tax=Alicyclobacillus shizuokensis TaxID=392014 RepID=UPI0008352451|nr:hypothetical protein [Alicyclobacillus shizuokensis]